MAESELDGFAVVSRAQKDVQQRQDDEGKQAQKGRVEKEGSDAFFLPQQIENDGGHGKKQSVHGGGGQTQQKKENAGQV